jgi:hypothetical protein
VFMFRFPSPIRPSQSCPPINVAGDDRFLSLLEAFAFGRRRLGEKREQNKNKIESRVHFRQKRRPRAPLPSGRQQFRRECDADHSVTRLSVLTVGDGIERMSAEGGTTR